MFPKALTTAAGLAFALHAGVASAADPTPGETEYRNHCQTCHGEAGKGDGPLAEIMTVPVPDLTTIAKRNDGTYPVQDIFMIIDGRSGVRGHGYPMPVWGKRYKAEAGDTYGPYGAEEVVRARVLELTYYIHGLQE